MANKDYERRQQRLKALRQQVTAARQPAAPTPPPYTPANPLPGTPEYQNAYNGMISGNIGYTPIQPGQNYPGMFQMGQSGQGIPNLAQPGHQPGGMLSSLFGPPAQLGGMFGGLFGGGQ